MTMGLIYTSGELLLEELFMNLAGDDFNIFDKFVRAILNEKKISWLQMIEYKLFICS
jgi:hypothetical protein